MELNEDLRLKLLGGKMTPIKLDNINIIPMNLKEIINIGYSIYQKNIINIIAEPSEFGITDLNITTYDVISSGMILGNDQYRDFVLNCLSMFIEDNISFDHNNGFVVTDVNNEYIGSLNKNNYENFKKIIKWQNCLENNTKEKMANKRAEEIMRKIKEGQEALNKKKGLEANFETYVSVLFSNSYSIGLNVFDLTIYQFYDQFKRQQMIEQYHMNIKSILSGAKPDDIDLRHYIRILD